MFHQTLAGLRNTWAPDRILKSVDDDQRAHLEKANCTNETDRQTETCGDFDLRNHADRFCEFPSEGRQDPSGSAAFSIK